MAKIFIYNNDTNAMEVYQRGENQVMPYVFNNSLKVSEFRGSSNSSVLWSDKRTMTTWSEFRNYYGSPIFVGFAFKRIWEGGHSNQSQHYAGTAFDTGQNLGNIELNRLRQSAIDFGRWSYVEPAYLTPTWVHVDKRNKNSACVAGYPAVKRGSRGNYVLILQDALNAIGYTGSGLDGVFGSSTEEVVKKFQRDNGLTVDGFVGCLTWTELTQKAKGIGLTATVVNP